MSESDVTDLKNALQTPVDRVVFYLLNHVGLRHAAICTLRTSDVWNDEKNEPRNPARAMEKGGRWRYFSITGDVQLEEAIRAVVVVTQEWLFPSSRLGLGGKQKANSSLMTHTFYKWVKDSGHAGEPQFYPHAFRAVLTNRLLSHGNSIEFVSKWLGHSSVHTTMRSYWKASYADLNKHMNIPWMVSSSTAAAKPDDDLSSMIASMTPRKRNAIREMILLKQETEERETRSSGDATHSSESTDIGDGCPSNNHSRADDRSEVAQVDDTT